MCIARNQIGNFGTQSVRLEILCLCNVPPCTISAKKTVVDPALSIHVRRLVSGWREMGWCEVKVY